jgi:hypothetical protein
MANADNVTGVPPLLTLIRMFGKVPTLALVGVPDNAPVAVLKVLQAGRLTMEKLSVVPPESVTIGVKL